MSETERRLRRRIEENARTQQTGAGRQRSADKLTSSTKVSQWRLGEARRELVCTVILFEVIEVVTLTVLLSSSPNNVTGHSLPPS